MYSCVYIDNNITDLLEFKGMPKRKLDPEQRRQKLFGRVNPETLQYLQNIGAPNLGRAVDQAVHQLRTSYVRTTSFPAETKTIYQMPSPTDQSQADRSKEPLHKVN